MGVEGGTAPPRVGTEKARPAEQTDALEPSAWRVQNLFLKNKGAEVNLLMEVSLTQAAVLLSFFIYLLLTCQNRFGHGSLRGCAGTTIFAATWT